MVQISRSEYAALYGPTVGDQVRLGDTDLWIEVEQDLTAGGEEAVFGGGKSIRESMAQGSTTRADGAPDTVITNVIVLDHWGIVRADVGIRDGRIVAIGRAGNSDVADGVHPRPADRAVHRRHLRRGQDPHRRRLRQPRAPDLPVADRRGAGHRADHARRRRHRAERGHQGHHRHAGRLAPGEDPPLHRPVPGQPAAARQGQHRLDGRPCRSRRWPAPAATRCTRTGAPPRPRSTRRCAAPTSGACRSRCTPTRSTNPATSPRRSPRSAAGRSARSTSRAPAAGTRRTS